MTTINLAYPEQSDIEFKISKFPDGQQTLDIINVYHGIMLDSVQIKSRLNSFSDLELIICANQILRNLGVNSVHLHVPYFLGARSDRRFQEGGVNYLKQVIGPIINSQGFNSITVLDPHSDVLEACLGRYQKQSNEKLVRWALEQIDNRNGAQSRTMFVSPDAGALKKIYDVAKTFKVNNVITAGKVRDINTGNIIRTEVPETNWEGIEQIIIIDDICDGGRTFIELAKELKKQTDKPVYLVVTHGIFSAGFEKLSGCIEGIFCTNSVKDVDAGEFVKQLNVF